MKFASVVTTLALASCGLAADANLPGLGSKQSQNARGVLSEVTKRAVGRQGCLATMATCLVESAMWIYANPTNVPDSLNYPYDRNGSDTDSVGMFQQRVKYYPDVKTDMDPAGSAGQFIAKMKTISGWQTMDVGTLCQKVQGSAYPTRYSERVEDAKKICDATGFK